MFMKMFANICVQQQAIWITRAKMALYHSPDYQTSFRSTGLSVQMKKFNIDFQDSGHGSHLGFPNRMI